MSKRHDRTQPCTPVYRSIMFAIEQRRLAAGLSMEELSDRAGFADRYYPKALYADAPGGRQARWELLQEMVDVLFPEGFEVEIRPKTGERLRPQDLRCKIKLAAFEAAPTDRRVYRELMRALGRKGGLARREKYKTMPREERLAIAKKARKTP